MHGAGRFRPAQGLHQIGRPGTPHVQQGDAGERQGHDGQGASEMGQPPPAAEPVKMGLALHGHAFGQDMRPVLALFAVLVFAPEPQGGMQPEERKGAQQQPDHEPEGEPHLRIFLPVPGRAVRLERDKPLGCVRVAGPAGLQAVADVHH